MQKILYSLLTNQEARRQETIKVIADKAIVIDAPWFNVTSINEQQQTLQNLLPATYLQNSEGFYSDRTAKLDVPELSCNL